MANFIPNEKSWVGFSAGPIGLMSAPATPTATESDGQGSLAAASYSYKVTAVNESGETAGSSAATVTTTNTGGVSLSWTAVTGASGYRVYGRTAGSEKLLTQVTGTSWLDTGALSAGTESAPTNGSASNIDAPTVSDLQECVELTRFVTGLNFSATGNTVPVPNLKTLFESTIPGTSTAQATMDCYRDDEVDTAWELLPRNTAGFVIISRYDPAPATAGKEVEVWPVRVTSRAMANMTSGSAVTFTLTFSVPEEPAESAIVAA